MGGRRGAAPLGQRGGWPSGQGANGQLYQKTAIGVVGAIMATGRKRQNPEHRHAAMARHGAPGQFPLSQAVLRSSHLAGSRIFLSGVNRTRIRQSGQSRQKTLIRGADIPNSPRMQLNISSPSFLSAERLSPASPRLAERLSSLGDTPSFT